MDLIPCSKHKTSKICFIYFSDEKVQLICDQCLDEDYKEIGLKFNQILSINKILIQPTYILAKLNWNNNLLQISQDLISDNKDQILEKINQLESQIKQFQDLFANMLNNFKTYIEKIQQLKQELISELPKILNYDQLKQILQGLQKSDEVINPDAIEQIQQQLNLYFTNMKKDNSEKFQICFTKKIEELQLKILEERKFLGKYEEANQKLEQFYKDQQQLANLLVPNIQINDLLLRSKIADSQYFLKLSNLIKDKMQQQKIYHKLIYLGSRDGLNAKSFWSKVNGKKNLLMIFKSKSNYIFGAYSPCQWQQSSGTWVQDNTNSSFLFSQTHDEIYPQVRNDNAIYCNSGYGPTFGGNHDMFIAADFQGGSSNLGSSYKQGSKFQNQYSTQLFGQATPNISECEIFEIIF